MSSAPLDPSELDAALDLSPEASARRAGLRYVSDAEHPGYVRKPWGRGVTYLDPEGEHVRDDAVRERLEALAIPPAWTDVWICEDPGGHLLATGRDDQGRKQYRYHPDWEQVRAEMKFNRVVVFASRLPRLRRRVGRDLRREGLPRDKVLALVVKLLDRTLIRVGGDTYAQQNASYGLTTLQDDHVAFDAEGCVFQFEGKSAQEHAIRLDDPRLARMVERCRDVPGEELFQYEDAGGRPHDVKAEHVNTYLRDALGLDTDEGFTAKAFRTWGGTSHAARVLVDFGPPESEKEADAHVVAMGKQVAEQLGNTPAVCRAYYIHPALEELHRAGALAEPWQRHRDRGAFDRMTLDESATLRLLRDRLCG